MRDQRFVRIVVWVVVIGMVLATGISAVSLFL